LETQNAPTGLPYHIYYGPEHLDLPSDIHHGNQGNRLIRAMFPDIVANAYRASRVHRVPIELHGGVSSIGFHRKYADTDLALAVSGPNEKISLGISGVVPRHAYDMSSGEGVLRYLNDEEYQFLTDPERTFVEGTHSKPSKREKHRLAIGHFYAHQALQHLMAQSEAAANIEEAFSGDEAVVRELGNLVYRQSMDILDDLLQPTMVIYAEAKKQDMVPAWSMEPHQAVREYLPRNRFGEYLQAAATVDISEKLAA
jgi:hypothetical protein